MEFIVEALLQFFGELILELVFEMLTHLGLQLRQQIYDQPSPLRPYVTALIYVGIGAGCGCLSYHIYPGHWLKGRTAAALYLIFVPVVAGLAMSAVGRWRLRRSGRPIRLDKFSFGWLFAMSFALVRTWATHR